ncbi:MAG TPA: hypothetical protein EYP14_05045 [Planctomycetaceae bacterium]|nr:hypothetical protein [Planctomycetaceae bacterium]
MGTDSLVSSPDSFRHGSESRALRAAVVFLLGVLSVSAALQSILGAQALAVTVVSNGLWQHIVSVLGATVTAVGEPGHPSLIAELPFVSLFLPTLIAAAGCLTAGGWWLRRSAGWAWADALTGWAYAGWIWWLLPGLWELARVAAVLARAA